jgi:polyketide cyclase/dehydrase/lipid transport protein
MYAIKTSTIVNRRLRLRTFTLRRLRLTVFQIFISCLSVGLGLTVLPSYSQSALTVNEDGARRSPDIHWPHGFSPREADLFAHNEISIGAPCSTVWRHIVEAPKWPQWYPNSQDVQIVGDRTRTLKPSSRFEFNTFGLHIDARISEFVPESRVGWFGDGEGINAYHTWLLISDPPGCHVVTEEVAKGPAAIALRESDPNTMHRGHDLWLNTLKVLSEK